MVSKNGSSSRAIPLAKQIENIRNGNYFEPNFWGINKPGMSADDQFEGEELEEVKAIWRVLVGNCIDAATILEQKKFTSNLPSDSWNPS